MHCVNKCPTENSDEVARAMAAEFFSELLHFCIIDTHVGFCDKTFVQMAGVYVEGGPRLWHHFSGLRGWMDGGIQMCPPLLNLGSNIHTGASGMFQEAKS